MADVKYPDVTVDLADAESSSVVLGRVRIALQHTQGTAAADAWFAEAVNSESPRELAREWVNVL